jgi:cytochrome b561
MDSARTTGWPRLTRIIHWLTVLGILVIVPVGYVMTDTYFAQDPARGALHVTASQVHHTIGFLLLLVFVPRLSSRLRAQPGARRQLPAFERIGANLIQALLYVILLALPLTGWAALSSIAPDPQIPKVSAWFFGHDGFGEGGLIPRIVQPVAWNSEEFFRYELFGRLHRWLLIAGAVTLTLHIAAALRHHFFLKDAILKEMIHPARVSDG